jgi:hypothetical protein
MPEGVSLTAGTQPATTSTEAPGAAGTTGNGSGTVEAQTTSASTAGVSLSQQQTSQEGQTTQTQQDVWSALDADARTLVESKNWKGVGDAVKAYKELETKFSSTRPAEAPQAVTEYDAVISKPDDADKLGYNDEFAKWLKDTGFKHKVSKDQLKGLHDDFVTWARSQASNVSEVKQAQTNERVGKAAQSLQEMWGAPNNPKFTRSLDMSMRAINNIAPGLKDALVEVGAIVKVGDKEMVAHPVIIDAFAKVGAAMYAEDTLYGAAAVSSNPFDPKTLDLTKQGQIIRQDKAKAASLIRALSPEAQGRYADLLKKLG